MRLGGWQRLWVALSVIYLLPVAIFGYSVEQMPTIKKIHDRGLWKACYSVAEAINEEERKKEKGPWTLFQPDPIQPHEFCEELKAKYPSAAEQIEWFKRLISESPNAPVTVVARKAMEEFQQDLDALPRRQFEHALFLLAIWLVPTLLVYALGWTVGWVIRGFRSQGPNK